MGSAWICPGSLVGLLSGAVKKAMRIVGALFLLGLIGGGLVFYFTGNMIKAADGFFAAVVAGDHTKAMSFTSSEFRAATPQPEFVVFLQKTNLSKFKSVSWESRSVSPGRGELEGTVSTEDGGSIPLKLAFVKENGEWRIYAFRKATAGIVGEPTVAPQAAALAPVKAPSGEPTPAPSPAAPVGFAKPEPVATAPAPTATETPKIPAYNGRFLVKVTMSKIAAAIRTGDNKLLIGTRGSAAETEAFESRLQSALKSIRERKIDVSSLVREEPVMKSAPGIDETGRLIVTGFFPRKPAKLPFRLAFVGHGSSWSLDDVSLAP